MFWFFPEKIDYLGLFIPTGIFRLAVHTRDAFAKLEHHSTQIEIWSFPELSNVFKQFIPILARGFTSLHKKLRNEQPKVLKPFDEKNSFAVASLKEALKVPSTLAVLKTTGWYRLVTTAFNKQMGCVFLNQQEDINNRLRRILVSHMKERRKKLVTTSRACLEVILTITLLRTDLEGACFTVRTNYVEFRGILTIADATGMTGCRKL